MALRDRIVVAVDFVTAGAQKSMRQLKLDVSNAEGGMNKLKAAGSGAFTALKANALVAGAAIGGALVIGASKAIDAASNLEESANAVDKVYGDASESVQKVGESAAESMGLSERAFNEAAVTFGAFASKIAGEGGNVTGVVQTFTQRAADFASVMNLDVSESLRVFQSALAGETEPIRKFGIDMSAASVKAHALSEGLIVSGQSMDEATKIQARYSLLMKSTNNTAGDFADTSDGLANSQRILGANIENLAAKLGDALIPFAADATEALIGFVDALDAMYVPEALQGIANMMKLLSGDFKATTLTLDGLTEAELAHRVALMSQGVALEEAQRRWEVLEDNLSRTTEAYNKVEVAISVAEREARIASRTNEDLKSSTVLVRDAIEDATDALKDEADAFAEAASAARDAAGAHIEAEESVWDQIEAVQEATAAINDEEVSLIDKARAINDVIEKTDDMVMATQGLTEESLNTEAGMRKWNDGMLAAADTMSGPMKRDVLDHIARVNGIPSERITDITAQTDRVAVARVKSQLFQLSKARFVNYIPRVVGGIPGGHGYSHTGSRFRTGEAKSILPGQAFIPDARFPFAAPSPGRMISPAATRDTTESGRSYTFSFDGATFVGEPTDGVLRRWAERMEQMMREFD